MIENFSLLSQEEADQFARDLVAKINDANIFSDGLTFEILDKVDTDFLDGSCAILVGPVDGMSIERHGTWYCDEDSTAPDGEIEYDDTIESAVKNALKCIEAEFNGYKLELCDFEVDDEEVEDTEVEDVESGDDGIGHYEWFGFTGYDSQPYWQATGIVYIKCNMSCWLSVVKA
jgi:hypothetical protein